MSLRRDCGSQFTEDNGAIFLQTSPLDANPHLPGHGLHTPILRFLPRPFLLLYLQSHRET